jgi:hypothetical protein
MAFLTISLTPVPEPATLRLLTTSLVCLGGRNAAFASSVVASIPIVFPFTRPVVLRHWSTQVKTTRCVSRAINRRVREIVE